MSTGTALLWHGNPSPSQPRMWAQLTRLPARALLDGVLKVLCKNYSSSVWGWNCHTRALNWPVNNERDTLPVPIHKNWAQMTSLVTRKILGAGTGSSPARCCSAALTRTPSCIICTSWPGFISQHIPASLPKTNSAPENHTWCLEAEILGSGNKTEQWKTVWHTYSRSCQINLSCPKEHMPLLETL